MKFHLIGGGYMEIIFYKDKQGVTHLFPPENTITVLSLGTEESKKTLEKILVDGVDSSSGHREGLRGDCWPPLLTFNDLEELAEKMGGHVVYYAGVADICRVGHTPVKSFKAVVTGLVYAEKDTVPDAPPKTMI